MTYSSSSGLSHPSTASKTSVVRITRSPRLVLTGFRNNAMSPGEKHSKRSIIWLKKIENKAAAHLSPALWLWCGSAAQESGSCHPTGGRLRSQQRLLQDDRCEGNVTGSYPKPAESSSSLLIQTPSLCLPEEQQTTWLKGTVHPEMKICSDL